MNRGATLLAAALSLGVAGCSGGTGVASPGRDYSPSAVSTAPSPAPALAPPPAAPGPAPTPPAAPGPAPASPAATSVPAPPAVQEATPAATPAPSWLGTVPLAEPGTGPAAPQDTPPELVDRRIVSPDLLPPPVDDAFHWEASPVPDSVLARSTWHEGCPVAAADLRYVTVSFWGFDGLPHTGELLLNVDAVDAVAAGFRAMHDSRFPLEAVRIVTAAELVAAPTGDGNTTTGFVCRRAVGSRSWSQHAYGRAVDVNPFHNPYDSGAGADRVVLPELATAYTDRSRELPGMVTAASPVVAAFEGAGWGWGGRWRGLKDWQHFSATGR